MAAKPERYVTVNFDEIMAKVSAAKPEMRGVRGYLRGGRHLVELKSFEAKQTGMGVNMVTAGVIVHESVAIAGCDPHKAGEEATIAWKLTGNKFPKYDEQDAAAAAAFACTLLGMPPDATQDQRRAALNAIAGPQQAGRGILIRVQVENTAKSDQKAFFRVVDVAHVSGQTPADIKARRERQDRGETPAPAAPQAPADPGSVLAGLMR